MMPVFWVRLRFASDLWPSPGKILWFTGFIFQIMAEKNRHSFRISSEPIEKNPLPGLIVRIMT
jgi:hypothetical protein